MSLEVVRVGPSALIQDRGRAGFAHLGVTTSGVADRQAAALALRCVGTDSRAPLLELLLGGFAVRTSSDLVCAVTGAPTLLRISSPSGACRRAASGEVLTLSAGDTLDIGRPISGLRSYLAVRGGIDTEPVLGSCSRDTLSQLGPAPLSAGQNLAIGQEAIGPWGDTWTAGVCSLPNDRAVTVLEVIPGPRADLFPPEAWDVLARTARVSAHCDRVGVRLEPAQPVPRLKAGEMPSEGMVRGSVQIPPDGRPVLFGPDHPVTGGYPVIGVLTERSADASSQLLPGVPVRLRRVNGDHLTK